MSVDLFPDSPKYIKVNGETHVVRRTRETSIQAKKEIEEQGLPGSIRADLMKIFHELHVPVTIGELWTVYINKFPRSGRSRNELAKRVSELRDFGKIVEVGKRRCELTHKLVLTFMRKP